MSTPIRLTLALALASGALISQQTDLSLSARIDSLMAKLIEDPGRGDIQRELIDAYLQTFNPELALLEISHAEALGQLGTVGALMKGRVQAILEQVVPAIRTLQLAYLQAPNDECLLLLGALEYARGEPRRGNAILTRLARRTPQLATELLKQYEKFYLNGRTTVARGIAQAMEEIDPVSYNTYFPRPQITVLSPADNSSTEAAQTSVIFEVKHSRPVKSVNVMGQSVFERSAAQMPSLTEDFSQSFTHLVPITEGKNVINIVATDVFGYEGIVPLVVNGISFSRVPTWSSPWADTLKQRFQLLRSYIPESQLFAERQPAYRALVVAVGGRGDSAEYVDRGLTMFDLLTHPYTGFVNPQNAKLLVGGRGTNANLTVVCNEWLIKGATFQSVTIAYFAGRWTITPERWLLTDAGRQQFDCKAVLEQLVQLATAGIVVVCDGVVDDPATFENGLRALVRQSTIPINVLVVPATASLPMTAVRLVGEIAVESAPAAGAELLTLYDLAQSLRADVIAREQAGIVLAQNVGGKISAVYRGMLSQLDQKLTSERASASVKQKIMDFSRDWRRYNEVWRYLNNQLSLADFVVRVDEYLSRRREGPGE